METLEPLVEGPSDDCPSRSFRPPTKFKPTVESYVAHKDQRSQTCSNWGWKLRGAGWSGFELFFMFSW